jgi:hypothetical protein
VIKTITDISWLIGTLLRIYLLCKSIIYFH